MSVRKDEEEMTPTKHPLTQEESARLAECEIVITKGFQNFYEVGCALIEISDKRLYRDTHSTFEEYCQAKWQITARHAYRLCEAAEVIKALPENVTHGSQINERQAREIKKAPKEKRAQVVETAAAKAESESRPMTARDVKEAVLEVCEPTIPKTEQERKGQSPAVGTSEPAPEGPGTDGNKPLMRNRVGNDGPSANGYTTGDTLPPGVDHRATPQHRHHFACRLTDLIDEASGNATADQLRSLKRELEASVKKIAILLKNR